MKRYLLLLALCGAAHAATVTVTWTNPTTNTDASAIPATGEGSLASARIEYGTCTAANVFGTKAGEVSRTMPVSSTTLNLSVGTTCVRVKVTNTYGVESDPSNVATKVIDPPKPAPPTIVTFAVVADQPNTPVYRVLGKETSGFYPGEMFGLVPTGRECEGPQVFKYRGASFHRVTVNTSEVWPATTSTANLAAPCA